MYRQAEPKPDVTFWYGPFDGGAWRAVLAAVGALIVALVILDQEKSVFRSLECSRTGACVITRGTDAFGPRRPTPAFDRATIRTATQRRTTGKNARHQLHLVDTKNESLLLFEGPAVLQWHDPIRKFFEDPSIPTLRVHVPVDETARLMMFGLFAVSIVSVAIWSAVAIRARARFRVTVDHTRGVLRVERASGSRLSNPREVALDQIKALSIASARSSKRPPCRVVIETREGSDFPLTVPFYRSAREHDLIVHELNRTLGLRP